MIVRKQNRVLELNKPDAKIYDYPLSGVKVGLSYQEYLEGRHPRLGGWKNTVCEEVYYILSGQASIFVDNEVCEAGEGDAVVIPVGSTSYLKTQGVKILTITNPDWYPEQHQEVK